MTALSHTFSFTYYYGILLPIPVILRGLIIFSFQALLLPFIIHSFLLFMEPQNLIVLEPGPVRSFCRESARLNHEIWLYSGLYPNKLCDIGQVTLEHQSQKKGWE